MTPSSPGAPTSSWNSIHVFETAERGRQAHYKLTSTVILQLVRQQTEEQEHGSVPVIGGPKRNSDHGKKLSGEISLSGSMTRQVNTGLEASFAGAFLFSSPAD